jgi:hypothetical protein
MGNIQLHAEVYFYVRNLHVNLFGPIPGVAILPKILKTLTASGEHMLDLHTRADAHVKWIEKADVSMDVPCRVADWGKRGGCGGGLARDTAHPPYWTTDTGAAGPASHPTGAAGQQMPTSYIHTHTHTYIYIYIFIYIYRVHVIQGSEWYQRCPHDSVSRPLLPSMYYSFNHLPSAHFHASPTPAVPLSQANAPPPPPLIPPLEIADDTPVVHYLLSRTLTTLPKDQQTQELRKFAGKYQL